MEHYFYFAEVLSVYPGLVVEEVAEPAGLAALGPPAHVDEKPFYRVIRKTEVVDLVYLADKLGARDGRHRVALAADI